VDIAWAPEPSAIALDRRLIRAFSANEMMLLLLATRWTVALSTIAFAGGTLLGLIVAVLRCLPARLPRWLAIGYINIFQGVPVLLLLFVAFFGLALLGIDVDPWSAASVGLSLYASAFLADIWRGCIAAVPDSQWEAAASLGLRYLPSLCLVILPQALRIAVPPTVGFLVQLVKSTSLASIIGFAELTRVGQQVNNATYEPLLVFGTVSAIYFALCFPLSFASRRLEATLEPGLHGNDPDW
jgi:polar amino acid transport system permease protein